jgi:hypothetical protein
MHPSVLQRGFQENILVLSVIKQLALKNPEANKEEVGLFVKTTNKPMVILPKRLRPVEYRTQTVTPCLIYYTSTNTRCGQKINPIEIDLVSSENDSKPEGWK